MTTLRIVLAEDHKVMREGLRLVLDRESDLEVVGEADDGVAAVRLTCELRPDVVVMDLSMPEMDGVRAEALRRNVTDIKIPILTRHAEGSYVRRMLMEGVGGYVLEQSAAEDLVRAIRRGAAGRELISHAFVVHPDQEKPDRDCAPS